MKRLKDIKFWIPIYGIIYSMIYKEEFVKYFNSLNKKLLGFFSFILLNSFVISGIITSMI